MRAIIAGVRSLRASEDEERAIVRGKLTHLERARIMAHLTGDFWSRVDEGQTVAILESRMGDHIASLVRKYGGTPLHTGPIEATSVRPRLCLSDASLPPHCATFSAPRGGAWCRRKVPRTS